MNIVQANLKYTQPLTPLNPDNILYIVLHHVEAEHATPEQIHEWHLANGWTGFGYNEYITKDGTVYIGRGDNVGAQCYNYNSVSYGICCEGNYEVEKDMPAEQFNSLVSRVTYHRKRFKNLKRIGGHREYYNTLCPGQYFPLEKVKLTAMLDMPTIKLGTTGQSVVFLQSQLNKRGYNLTPDGIFGVQTQQAVKSFQQKNGLSVDGIVGPFTWSKIL
jgi:N-acetylmuramoyl-L-alanine amidase